LPHSQLTTYLQRRNSLSAGSRSSVPITQLGAVVLPARGSLARYRGISERSTVVCRNPIFRKNLRVHLAEDSPVLMTSHKIPVPKALHGPRGSTNASDGAGHGNEELSPPPWVAAHELDLDPVDSGGQHSYSPPTSQVHHWGGSGFRLAACDPEEARVEFAKS
jgi:hypothetical protein